jgi:hypothetical protein
MRAVKRLLQHFTPILSPTATALIRIIGEHLMKASIVKLLSGYLSAAHRRFGGITLTAQSETARSNDTFGKWLREYEVQNRAEMLRNRKLGYGKL